MDASLTTFHLLPVSELYRILDGLGRSLVRSTLLGKPASLERNLAWMTNSRMLLDRIEASQVARAATNVPSTKDWLEREIREQIAGARGAPVQSNSFLTGAIRSVTRFGGVEFPRPLVWAIAELAWSDPLFQASLLRRLKSFLQSNYILPSLAVCLPTIHPNTIWCLISLSPVPVKSKDSHRVLTWLKQIASEVFIHTAWAGFWDQWLIGQMIKKSTNPSVEKVLGLPYLSQEKSAPAASTLQLGAEMARERWAEEIPEFLRASR